MKGMAPYLRETVREPWSGGVVEWWSGGGGGASREDRDVVSGI
jgi:hypothetical protein